MKKRYFALLRGINVSGKNRLVMTELKRELAGLGFEDIVTVLNSGNVVFTAEEKDIEQLSPSISDLIRERFGLDVPVFAGEGGLLTDVLAHAPDWWDSGDKALYDNLIFLLPPLDRESFIKAMGEPKEELEQAFFYQNAVFWTFDRKQYQKTNWWHKTAASPIAPSITIRTAGTMNKLAAKL